MDISHLWDLIEQIKNLDFSIPSDIFNALYALTNFAGYILPLRLYSPILLLILSYWALMIAVNAGKGLLSFIGSLGGLFGRLGKK